MLSDRIGLRKAVIYPVLFMLIVGVGLLSITRGVLVWPLVIVLIGLANEGFVAVLITMMMETKGVGAAYTGTALGLNGTIGGLSGFFAPPIGNRLAEINASFAFIFWASLAAIGMLLFRFVEETGWRKKSTQM
jgi:nitrate/nitrite transporter NarK